MAEPGSAPAPPSLRVAGAQIPNVVGDIDGNARRIGEAMEWAEQEEADLLLLPELALTGYPVEDLAVRKDFVAAAVASLEELATRSGSVTTIVGSLDPVPPRRSWDTQTREVAIGAALLCDGELRGIYHKVLLPNYAVFDEARNFAPGTEPGVVWRVGEAMVGLSICEDSWSADGPPEAQAAGGAQLLLFQNASPFERAKSDARLAHCRRLARRNGLPVLYVNSVGGQDELVFDGGSLVVSATGELVHRAPQFEADRFCIDLEIAPARPATARPRTVHARPAPRRRPPLEEIRPVDPTSDLEQVWAALAMGVRDFAVCNGTDEAVVAISGGIDAAVAAAVAADALGPERVRGICMPGPRTRGSETADARELADALGISLWSFPVEPVTDRIGPEASEIAGRDRGELVRRNLDSRIRAAILQTIADEIGALAVATVNKTELSVGSFAPHDAMAGGFAP
ncbi:MAG: NAD(+) synthase, partial [Solirubrobacterales bacterium]